MASPAVVQALRQNMSSREKNAVIFVIDILGFRPER
jgi:hypothetical protein